MNTAFWLPWSIGFVIGFTVACRFMYIYLRKSVGVWAFEAVGKEVEKQRRIDGYPLHKISNPALRKLIKEQKSNN